MIEKKKDRLHIRFEGKEAIVYQIDKILPDNINPVLLVLWFGKFLPSKGLRKRAEKEIKDFCRCKDIIFAHTVIKKPLEV